jgi:hypothetical protein
MAGETLQEHACHRPNFSGDFARLNPAPGDELENDHNHCDHQQQMDEATTNMERECPKQPEHEENDCNCPEHDVSPLAITMQLKSWINASFLPQQILTPRSCLTQ